MNAIIAHQRREIILSGIEINQIVTAKASHQWLNRCQWTIGIILSINKWNELSIKCLKTGKIFQEPIQNIDILVRIPVEKYKSETNRWHSLFAITKERMPLLCNIGVVIGYLNHNNPPYKARIGVQDIITKHCVYWPYNQIDILIAENSLRN